MTATFTEPIVGVFDEMTDGLYIRYQVECQFLDKVMGGVPQKPDLIAGWIRSKMGLGPDSDAELASIVRQTLLDLGVETPENATLEEIMAASEKVGAERHGNTFKRDEQGLYLESRQLKAGLKEAVAVLFSGDRWGKTRKGPKNALAEWVFVEGQRIHLGRTEPDGTWTQHGVVPGPQGARSTLTQYDYVEKARIRFVIRSIIDPSEHKERITADQWKMILLYLQDSGFGALRSQSHGQFKVVGFDRL
jgi:hypothetical protein